jgi:hypothetical protein
MPIFFIWIFAGVTIEVGLVFILVAIPFLIFIYLFFGRIKVVSLHDNNISISNYIKSINVSLKQVEYIHYGNKLFNPWLVYIKFKENTAFGKEIIFWRNYKISTVSLINEMIKETKS